jgi:hypothetical protein
MNEHLEYDGISELGIEQLKFLISLSADSLIDLMSNMNKDELNYSMLLIEMYRYRIYDNVIEKSNLKEAKQVIRDIMKK